MSALLEKVVRHPRFAGLDRSEEWEDWYTIRIRELEDDSGLSPEDLGAEFANATFLEDADLCIQGDEGLDVLCQRFLDRVGA